MSMSGTIPAGTRYLLAMVVALPVATSAQPEADRVADMVEHHLDGYRVALTSDLDESIRNIRGVSTILEADFNLDGHDDWAVMVINDQESVRRFYLVLGPSAAPTWELLTDTSQDGQASTLGPTYMQLKPPGEGALDNAYLQYLDLPVEPYVSPESRRRREHFDRTVKAVPGVYICGAAACTLTYYVDGTLTTLVIGD